MSSFESVFTLEATQLKFGAGAAEELGWELKRFNLKSVILVTDPALHAYGLIERIEGLIAKAGVSFHRFEDIRVEPTIESLQKAVDFCVEHPADGFVALGGGSTMDTAKVSNLITVHGGQIMDYAHHLRLRLRGDNGRHPRHSGPARQNRHFPPFYARGACHR